MSAEDGLPRLWWSPRPGRLAAACLDAGPAIGAALRRFASVVLASATPGPLDVLGPALGLEERALRAVPAEAPWRAGSYDVACDLRVDTRFQERSRHLPTTAASLAVLRWAAGGPVAAFFPSYGYAEGVAAELAARDPGFRAALQPRALDLAGQAAWIERELTAADGLLLVTGSSFAEGIDVLGGRVTHAMVVGPALPEVNAVQKARLALGEAEGGRARAFRRIYQVPGMQKVNQALGRLVRGPGQRARVLLHCRRFALPEYLELLDPACRPAAFIRGDRELEDWLAG